MFSTCQTCSECQFWDQLPDEDGRELGKCRRFPPSYEGWAMSMSEDWCGEFKDKSKQSAG